MGAYQRDLHLIQTIKDNNFDLVVYSKCNQVGFNVFEEINKVATTCLWFMDPLISYSEEMRMKTKLVDYFCCDKKNVLEEAQKINSNSFYVCEGFDSRNDKPHDVPLEHDVTFIGNPYGDRQKILKEIKAKLSVISNAYGKNHAIEVSKSKINLNFCTADGASDRVYKILAAKGFLLTDDWEGRSDLFEDNKDLVIFKDIDDLNTKIEFYLDNPQAALEIAEQGFETVQDFTRIKWAEKVVHIYEQIR